VKKLPLFAVALVAAIPAFWFMWIVVGGPMWEGNYGTYQVEVFKNKVLLVLLLLTLVVFALIAFMPFLVLIFGGGSDSHDGSVALATPGGGDTALDVDPETGEMVDDDPFVSDGEDAFDDDEDDDDPFADDEDDDDPFAEGSDDELDIEGLDDDDIFAFDDDE